MQDIRNPGRTVEAFCPAGVGNIGVGFDLLGHVIQGPGDRVTVRRVGRPEIHLHVQTLTTSSGRRVARVSPSAKELGPLADT